MVSIYEYRPILIFCVCVAAVIGAVMGSFLNCAAWRMAHNESFLKGRSRCPKCGHTLTPLELIPVFSWIFLKGKCRACGEKISIRYPLTELFFALISVLCLLRFDLTPLCLRNYVFLCCLFGLALTDMESMIIPDGFHIVMIAAWLLALPFIGLSGRDIAWNVGAAVLYSGGILGISLIMDKMLGRESLGGGDVKLIAVAGLYLGPVGMLFMLILACITGLVYTTIRRRRESGGAFPFGPFISLAAGFMCLYGGGLVDWYLGLLSL